MIVVAFDLGASIWDANRSKQNASGGWVVNSVARMPPWSELKT